MTKKHKKGRINFKGVSIVIVFALSMAFCVVLAEMFSQVITVGNFSIFAPAKSTSFEVYAVSLQKFSTKVLATEYASDIKKQNGAGYIWKVDGVYHVLASAYEKENDATLVRDNLKKSGLECEILKISFDEIEIDTKDSKSKESILSSSKIYREIFKGLYDISVSVDTQVYNETKARILVDELTGGVDKTLEDIKSDISSESSLPYLIVKVKLKSLKSILVALSKTSETGVAFCSEIKYSYLNVLTLYKELVEELNNT